MIEPINFSLLEIGVYRIHKSKPNLVGKILFHGFVNATNEKLARTGSTLQSKTKQIKLKKHTFQSFMKFTCILHENKSKSLFHRVMSIRFHLEVHCKFGTTKGSAV